MRLPERRNKLKPGRLFKFSSSVRAGESFKSPLVKTSTFTGSLSTAWGDREALTTMLSNGTVSCPCRQIDDTTTVMDTKKER